ncbi:hypothetical protein CAPTEDRAFT_228177 [Capitella teleta]|uniref:ER-bound oxygenase mpaB/mpaB'/Rubber oxygenase catalytic domain-containing protein n=1 Tax=Capitella teleta TaxID=283909 RepID=R7UH62_CAPTE|nr:hypothetical protein CAPTEDRAFT_228177 [Capitella teleta]|eukprot:ELU05540.1 hypothetical protein CAPTEDRAFT_228177 [Capitella teleta]
MATSRVNPIGFRQILTKEPFVRVTIGFIGVLPRADIIMAKCLLDLKEGETECGDCGYDPSSLPSWMDLEKFKRGQEFFRQHTMSILLALYCSLTTGLSITNLLDPLVFTKKSDTPSKALSRYVYTFLHIATWHIGNVWCAGDSAHKSLQIVRRMHRNVAEKMNSESEKLHVSQYDMALVQSGFMGAVVMYPWSFGIACSASELHDYIFFWRGIGYLLGIDDKYNICSGTYFETVAICKEIEQKLLLPSLKNPPLEFDRMADAYIEGTNMRRRFLTFTKESVVGFSLGAMGHCVGRLSFRDRMRVWWLKALVVFIRWCPLFSRLNNRLILRSVRQFSHVLFRGDSKKQS